MLRFPLLHFSLITIVISGVVPLIAGDDNGIYTASPGIFNDLYTTEVGASSKIKLVYRASDSGWKKPLICATGIAAGTLALAALYPPAAPFFVGWSCRTKAFHAASYTLFGAGMIMDNAILRRDLIYRHNENRSFHGILYNAITKPGFFALSYEPFLNYVLLPLGIGIVLGILGMKSGKHQ